MKASKRVADLLDGKRAVTGEDLREIITRHCKRYETREKAAQSLDMSLTSLKAILGNKRSLSEDLAGRLGWECVTLYVRRDAENV